jgi:hypothetical protein
MAAAAAAAAAARTSSKLQSLSRFRVGFAARTINLSFRPRPRRQKDVNCTAKKVLRFRDVYAVLQFAILRNISRSVL